MRHRSRSPDDNQAPNNAREAREERATRRWQSGPRATRGNTRVALLARSSASHGQATAKRPNTNAGGDLDTTARQRRQDARGDGEGRGCGDGRTDSASEPAVAQKRVSPHIATSRRRSETRQAPTATVVRDHAGSGARRCEPLAVQRPTAARLSPARELAPTPGTPPEGTHAGGGPPALGAGLWSMSRRSPTPRPHHVASRGRA